MRLGFPDVVDEVSARIVAGGVVLLAAATVATHFWPLYLLLAYGFLARVLAGPRYSPLGLLATRVVRPRLAVAPRLVPGPPKRLAQGLGLVASTLALVLALGLDQSGAGDAMLGLLASAAALEAGLGLCLGCMLHDVLARAGIVRACADCVDVTSRPAPERSTR